MNFDRSQITKAFQLIIFEIISVNLLQSFLVRMKHFIPIETRYVGTMLCPKHDKYITPSLLDHGVWEDEERNWMENVVKPGDVCVNVGSHVGYFATQMSQLVGPSGFVYCFEPNIELLPALILNLRTKSQSGFKIYPYAVSDKSSKARLWVNSLNTGDSRLFDPRLTYGGGNYLEHGFTRNLKVIEVKVVSLDEMTELPRVNVLLIDAQGYDLRVLHGSLRLIETFRPYICFEYVPEWLRDSGNLILETFEIFWNLGYSLHCIVHGVTFAICCRQDLDDLDMKLGGNDFYFVNIYAEPLRNKTKFT